MSESKQVEVSKPRRRQHRAVRAIPARQSKHVGVIMEPSLYTRLKWLSESQGLSMSHAAESILARELAGAQPVKGGSDAIKA